MRFEIIEKVQIPEGINCSYADNNLICKNDSFKLEMKINFPRIFLEVAGNEIIIRSPKANKIQKKTVNSLIVHIRNTFSGLEEKFVYKLEAVNVHFPMTLKVEGSKLVINNFLGEKVPRTANILKDVEVEIKGQQITVSSHYKELAGQTAANFEKATKVGNRDRRIFQDGIYIISKAGEEL